MDRHSDTHISPPAAVDGSGAGPPAVASLALTGFWRVLTLFFVADGLAAVGMATISPQTVVAVLLHQVGFANLLIGVSMAIPTFAIAVAQVPCAYWASRARRKGIWLTWLRVGEAAPRLLLVVGALLVAPSRPLATVMFLFAPLFIGSLMGGAWRPVRAELDARLVSLTRRGRYQGTMMVAKVTLALAGAALARFLIAEIPDRGGFGACFAAAGLFGIASAIPLAYLPEPEERDSHKQGALWDYLRTLRRSLASDANYRNFLWGRALVGLGQMAGGFFAVYAMERFHVPAKTAPLFMFPYLIGQGMGSTIWGYVGDKRGQRLVQLAVCVQYGLAPLVALVAPNPWVLALAFWLNGMAFAGDFVSTTNFLLEAAPNHDLMGYVGFANSLISPIFAVSSILGGAIADATSFPLLFLVTPLVWVAAFWIMAVHVRDPRTFKRTLPQV